MDPKLQEIIQRLTRKRGEARKFQDTMAKRIKQMDQELAKLKAHRSETKKKQP